MSASAIADVLISNLAASSFGTGGAGTDYKILETTGGASCCIVNWRKFEASESAFSTMGNAITGETIWTMSLELFIKDTGLDPKGLVGASDLGVVDSVIGTLRTDWTLSGTIEGIVGIRGEREVPPDGYFDAGGATWARRLLEVDCLEIADD